MKRMPAISMCLPPRMLSCVRDFQHMLSKPWLIKRRNTIEKVKLIWDHEHLYEALSATDKTRCQVSPFTVEEIFGEKWLREKLCESLSVLSESERMVIMLLYKYELTSEQAARKLGVTSSTILSLKKNALDKLKKEMLGG